MTLRHLFLGLAASVLLAAPALAQVPSGSPQDLFKNDVHARAGITCETCHTGATAGQFPAIARTKIAPLCGTCHSDAAVMRSTPAKKDYKIDQFTLYQTSKHGQDMAKGDVRVATCTDCHGAHGILPVEDPKSPVALRNVAGTCARCHGDAKLMEAFDKDGTPPDDWKNSVHGVALLKNGDTSAPTCPVCHSEHGPVGQSASKMPLVCAQCHVREAELFTNGPHKVAFDQANEPGCISCHSNHHIKQPSDAFVGVTKPAVCAGCHDDQMKGADTILAIQKGLGQLSGAVDRAQSVLEKAQVEGMLVDDGLLALHDAREQQVFARLLVHGVAAKPFTEAATKGLTAAATAETIGNHAMAEMRYRRNGLAVATALIIGFLITLGIKIRRLPPPTP